MAIGGSLGALAQELAMPGFAPPQRDGVVAGLRREQAGPAALQPIIFAGGRDWPALRFRAAGRPLDWSGAEALAVPVENPSSEPFEVLLRLDDRPDANGDDRSLTGLATVPAHARVTLVLPLGPAPAGMRGRPPSALVPQPGDQLVADARGRLDASHVTAFHLSGTRSATDRTLLIGTPELRMRGHGPGAAPFPLADRFGQAAAGRWPEKVTSDDELKARLAAAERDVRRLAATAPRPADGWGGVAGPLRRATGFFRVEKIGTRWALVTPAGHAFLSLGVDAVRPDNPTLVAGREQLFAGLPSTDSPLAAFYGEEDGRRTFDVGRADLRAGLGPEWSVRWPENTIARLKAWGFNTLGNWSDPQLDRDLPHVAFTDVEGDQAIVPMGGRALVDPFDPRFAGVADAVAATMAANAKGDRGLIGYFSGNELPWGEADRPEDGLVPHVLALRADSPARQALVDALKARYPSPQAWAAAWGAQAASSWDDAPAWPATPTRAALADAARFEEQFAARYFSIVAGALKRHDPDHLYLGTRFASATPAVVRACARWCDAMSFNVYGKSPAERSALWRGLDKPVLIGEFHFGSLDRGSFWPGMVAVAREEDRGAAYTAYLEAAVADPAVIGVHWYQYADEPLTGRPYDGENGHIGLVAVTGVPFSPFVEEVAAANRRALATFRTQLSANSPD